MVPIANIKDIARIANVSVTTVSRVLNNHPYVSSEKREAVQNAITATNYQRNINAVHLSKGQTQLIGVVIPFVNHPYFGLLLEGIAKEAVKNNYKLILFQTNYEEKRELEALEMLRLKQIDALIICSRTSAFPLIDEYQLYGPIIICEDGRGKNVSSTFIDHYKSFTEALRFLHQKGHQKIAYCLARKDSLNSHSREKAYLDFLQTIKEPLISTYRFYDCMNFEDGQDIMKKIMSMSSPPTALITTSDQVAAGVLHYCREKHISVPNDLAIISFDNQPIAQVMKLTTFEMPLLEMGHQLLQQALHPNQPTHNELFVHLIERETV